MDEMNEINRYIIGIDQSTQGTKALIFDGQGRILGRSDLAHDQIVNELGWVEHNPEQIYSNTLQAARMVIEKTGIDKSRIAAIGLTNQRETAVVWDRESGRAVYNAIVWQCARGASICKGIEEHADMIQSRTGLNLSPYFSAAKIAWVLEEVEGARERSRAGKLAYGTMDSWLIYRLTGNQSYKTDYSNASRTQLFNIRTLQWDEEICGLFGINPEGLAKVCDSNANFGETDLGGYLERPIPIHSAIGDSHGALFGQNCWKEGMVKATYGTGSSIMMNIGTKPIFSSRGIVTSLAWGISGKVSYVLEGNINYTGAVISWLKDDLGLIKSAAETEELAKRANAADRTYLVPAFSGLGAPYWNSGAAAVLCGMTRRTGKAEIVKAALESIAYQITDIVKVMSREAGIKITQLRADGGPTRNGYLMQFQSDMLDISVRVPETEELSVIGAAYMAGIGLGMYRSEQLSLENNAKLYQPEGRLQDRQERYEGWKTAVAMVLNQYPSK